jgi:hypothetical protein
MRARFALAALALFAACGDDGFVGFPDGGPCWPIEAKPGGKVELGTGDVSFEPLSDTLTVVHDGSQSDPFVQLHSRVRGMPPGDRDDPFDPRNPRTKVEVVIEALNLTLGIECPASLGYVPSREKGSYDLIHSLRLGFGLYPLDQVSGKQARLTIEVVGSNLVYASDEKTVTLMVP